MLNHREWPVYFTTLIGVVSLNLLEGVGVGVVLAVVMLLRRLTRINVQVEQRLDNAKIRWHARIEGSLTFLSVPALTARLSEIPAGVDVDVDLMVDFMDHAAFEALHSWRVVQEKSGGQVDIDELHEHWYHSAENGSPIKHRSRMIPPERNRGVPIPAEG